MLSGMYRNNLRNNDMKKTCVAAVIVFLLASPALSSENWSEILKKVDERLQPESFESYRKLINIEPDGKKREYLLFTLKKGNDKVASLFLLPASDKGRATLRLGDNMWLYIPNVGKPVRITSLQSVVGGVFNNADIMRLDYHVEYDVANLQDNGEEYLLDLKAKTVSVAYDKLKMWVDKKTMAPTKIECYAATGLLIKTLYFKEMKSFGDGVERPAVLETDSPLYRGYKSIMVYAKVNQKDIPDEVFTLSFLPRLESTR